MIIEAASWLLPWGELRLASRMPLRIAILVVRDQQMKRNFVTKAAKHRVTYVRTRLYMYAYILYAPTEIYSIVYFPPWLYSRGYTLGPTVHCYSRLCNCTVQVNFGRRSRSGNPKGLALVIHYLGPGLNWKLIMIDWDQEKRRQQWSKTLSNTESLVMNHGDDLILAVITGMLCEKKYKQEIGSWLTTNKATLPVGVDFYHCSSDPVPFCSTDRNSSHATAACGRLELSKPVRLQVRTI
jgi:hypothetical protein